MKKYCLIFALILSSFSGFAQENVTNTLRVQDSARIAELDKFWNELAKTVREGDIEGYAEGYHEDAVVVFAGKTSVPIEVALEGWKQGFIDTKAGKATSDVEFRFSERIGDETTAHETGIFYFTLTNDEGKVQKVYAHLEALLVKRDGVWKCIMENQKSSATAEEWKRLK